MSKYKLIETTYATSSCTFKVKELCFENGDRARFFKLASCLGRKCVRITCYINGEYETQDDMYGDFDNLTPAEAYRLAKEVCIYFK